MIYHYYGGGSSGVFRFDTELRKVFPEMQSVITLPTIDVTCYGDSEQQSTSGLYPMDTVITDNHKSLDVPGEIKTVAVHHGCAKVHCDRDSSWLSDRTMQLVLDQFLMFTKPDLKYVAPSEWVQTQFREILPWYKETLIPHWVPFIPQLPKSGKPIIIGDWRDNNKGANVWRKLAAANPQWEFLPLSFKTEPDKLQQYGEASLYLCLSLSEGGSYSMCDAEAAELPIVSTDVGNYREFSDCEVISWQDRDNLQIVADAIERKLKAGRKQPSFYQNYTFEKWAELWRNVVLQSVSQAA